MVSAVEAAVERGGRLAARGFDCKQRSDEGRSGSRKRSQGHNWLGGLRVAENPPPPHPVREAGLSWV